MKSLRTDQIITRTFVTNEVARKMPMCALRVGSDQWWGHRPNEAHHWDCFIDHSTVGENIMVFPYRGQSGALELEIRTTQIIHAAGALMDGRTSMARFINKHFSPVAMRLMEEHPEYMR